MKGKGILATLLLVVMFTVFGISAAPAVAADTAAVTITGVITDTYDLEAADGTVYKVAPGAVGDKMSGTAGVKVKATGTVETKGGDKVLTVISYEPAK